MIAQGQDWLARATDRELQAWVEMLEGFLDNPKELTPQRVENCLSLRECIVNEQADRILRGARCTD
jgi:hypothetical protein